MTVLAWNPHLERAPLLAAAAGKEVLLYNVDDKRSAMHSSLQTHQRPVSDMSWSLSDPNVLATCSADTYINLWDFRDTRRPTRLKSMCGWTTPIHQVKFNRRNPFLLASAHDSEIRIWDIRRESQPILKHVSAHAAPITQLEWLNSDARYNSSLSTSSSGPLDALILLSTSLDRSLRLWALPAHFGPNSNSPFELDASIERAAQGGLILLANTTFQNPIGRAKFAPPALCASAICVAATTMKGSDYSIKLVSLSEQPPVPAAAGPAPPPFSFTEVQAFAGHADTVSSLDWRSSPEGTQSAPTSASASASHLSASPQLASWSARDQQFRLWCVLPGAQAKIRSVSAGFSSTISAAVSQLSQSLQLTALSNATVASSPSHSFSNSGLGVLSFQRDAPMLPQLLTPLPVPSSVGGSPLPSTMGTAAPGVLAGSSSSSAAVAQPISTMQDWEACAGSVTSLEQELSLVPRLNIVSQSVATAPQQWVSVSFDEITPAKRTVVAFISVAQQLLSWSDSGDAAVGPPANAALRLRIVFPSLYPHSASPSIETQGLLVNHVNLLRLSTLGQASPSPSPSSSFSSPLPSPSPSTSSEASPTFPWGVSPSVLIAWLAELKEAWSETNFTAVEAARPCLHLLLRDGVSFLRSLLVRLSKSPSMSSTPATPVKLHHLARSSETRLLAPPAVPNVPVSSGDALGALVSPSDGVEERKADFAVLPTPSQRSQPLPSLVAAPSPGPVPIAPGPVHLAEPQHKPDDSQDSVEEQQGYLQSAGEISLLSHHVAMSLNSTASSPYNSAPPTFSLSAKSPETAGDSRVVLPRSTPALMVSSARGAALPDSIDLAQNSKNMPAPRWCGAAWSTTGSLVWWGRVDASPAASASAKLPSVLQIPRTFSEFVSWKAIVISRSRELHLRRQQRVRELERLRHESEVEGIAAEDSANASILESHFDDETDPIVWNSRVAVADCASILPVSLFLARAYRLHGHISIARMCSENAELSRFVGRPDLVRAWSLLALQSNSSLNSTTWPLHPLGRRLVQELTSHYEQIGDVQMLALMACALSGPLSVPRVAIAISKGIIRQQYESELESRAAAHLARLSKRQHRERIAMLLKHHRQRAKLRQQLSLLPSPLDSAPLASTHGTVHQLRTLQARQMQQQDLLLRDQMRQRQLSWLRSTGGGLAVDGASVLRIRSQPLPSLMGPLVGVPEFLGAARSSRTVGAWNAIWRDSRFAAKALFGAQASLLHRNFRLHRFSRLSWSVHRMNGVSRALWQRASSLRFSAPTSAAALVIHTLKQPEFSVAIDSVDVDLSTRQISSSAELAQIPPDSLEQARLEALLPPRSPFEQDIGLVGVVRGTSAHTNLIGSDAGRYDVYKNKYADILLSWGLLRERAEVLKCLTSSDSRSSHVGPVFGALCKCGSEVPGSYCRHCSRHSFECTICRLPAKGSTLFCMNCGHGGHSLHVREWFSAETACPSGCGCQCQLGRIGD